MTVLRRLVMLLKTEKGSTGKDEYEELLQSHDFKVVHINTLVFKFHDLTNLKKQLGNSNDYSGLLLSSPRCVEAVHLALNRNILDVPWRDKQNYVVGEATHLAAFHKLGIDCRGKESGNSKNLAEIIVRENAWTDKPFLFPHGNLKTDTLKLELSKSNISIKEVLVYDTLSNPNIEEDFSNITKGYTEFPEYVVFFSPSGVRCSIELLRKKPAFLEQIQFIAIGPVTAMAMKEENLKIKGVATNPNPREVLNLMI